MRPSDLTVADAAAAIAARRLSPVELTESVLERLEATQPRLNAYVTVTADAARAAAARAERELLAGRHRGPLHGIPYALKDNIDTAGIRTTASSRQWADRVPTRDATLAARLTAAGAVLVGKTHTHEFAYGLTTPQTGNPWHPDRVAGGSSGGSAVAVATGSALFALGTDTAGSVRVPAALNGVVGLKPTYGLLSCHGIAPLAWSLDHPGPITRTAHDAALVLDALTGQDPHDPATHTPPPADVPRPHDLRGLRVGIPRTYFFDRITPDVDKAVRTTIDHLTALGARTVEIDTPLADHLLPTLWGLMAPEASAAHEHHLRHTPHLYGDDVRTLLEAGRLLPAVDHLVAQRARTLINRTWRHLFTHVDVLATPTVPLTATPRTQSDVHWPDSTTETVTNAYLRLTAPANLTGQPALTLPIALDPTGLPIGLQLIAPHHHEPTLFHLATTLQQALPTLRPPQPLA
ncbi:amidase [Kitasatospora sp. NPDC058115]|uniref:amidase n=1 Tax=Kitasatospora sp. NPDC058115 TaxID=3346347 RepID=UPI0036D7E048